MVVNATVHDKLQIYELWKKAFADHDGGYIDYFFGELFAQSDTLIVKENGKVLSTLTRRKNDIMLNGRILKASFFLGVTTVAEYRGRGLMHEVMNEALKDAQRQELITLIQSDQPQLYTSFGFETVYKRKRYVIEKNQVQKCTLQGVSAAVTDKEMMLAYASFVRHFDGYLIRDEKYFARLRREVTAQKGQIVAYYNADKQIEGYVILYPGDGCILAHEIVYKSSLALIKLLNVAFRMNERVILTTSEAEQIEKAIPGIEAEKIDFMMARINDYELFNRFYGKDVKTVQEAFHLSKKPLYLHEYA